MVNSKASFFLKGYALCMKQIKWIFCFSKIRPKIENSDIFVFFFLTISNHGTQCKQELSE